MADILFFPIRHHSPACAWHLERLIDERRPRAILIEGPRDATALLEQITHAATQAPIAIYTTFVDTTNQLAAPTFDRAKPARFSAYYPLADYSPELVAIRKGRAAGAAVRFIDLMFPEMVLAEGGQKKSEQARSLLDEHHMRHSRFLKALCERTGARDPDDLWDHLYETDFQQMPSEEFIKRVETYCALSRADYTTEMLAAEAHLAREAAMAAEIAAEAEQGDGLILVVTGGFHTPGLKERLAADEKPTARHEPITGDAQTLLMRYGFAQLDRLNGYASGMPSPAFYQRVWEHLHNPKTSDTLPAARATAEFIVELGRLSREKAPGLSPADEIAALDQTRRLAGFRQHPQPTREDLLDGIRSSFIKGSADAEGLNILTQARVLLAGDRIGDLPPDVGVAPLVDDFRRTARNLKLDISTLAAKEAHLDLYRHVNHRAISHFFHRLAYLDVPFGERRSGPDFVAGSNLERIAEIWRYAWSPDTESKLTEQTLYGGTLEEASANLLQHGLDEAEAKGLGRRSDVTATQLLHACRMGLQRFAPELLARTAALIAEDASFISLVSTAEQLLLLHSSREPLEAHHLTGLTDIANAACQRAYYLLPQLAGTGAQEENDVLDALNALQQVMLSLGDSQANHVLLRNGLRLLLDEPGGNPAIRGGAVGALHADGQMTDDELIRWVSGHMEQDGPGFLRGVLHTNRPCLWQVTALLENLNSTLCAWDESQFVRVLPELRLAFADLTAHEADLVARTVARQVGASVVPSLRITGAQPEDLLLGAALNQRVEETLARDGLAAFLEEATR
ncbi:MAG TPA: DUF5682 family protein [Ktedonobacterales bacterium]|nr:DUF5682 family protein [Ktedonobacterales bacterium]